MGQFSPEGRILKGNRELTPEKLAEAMETGEILEGIPTRCDSSHNLHLQLGGLSAVIPREECAVGVREGATKEIAILTRVGKPTCFVVEGMEGQDGKLVPRLSRRKAQERSLSWLMSLPLGSVLPAVVTHLEPFGAFVDVGCGVPSLLPLDVISASRIPHPSSRFRVGDSIHVILKGKLPEQNRVLLSHKELMGTWAENAAQFSQGEVVTGVVRGVMDYGLFVELAPNLPALAEPMDGISCGDEITVFIKSILPQREKIKLIVLGRCGETPTIRTPKYFITEGIVRDWQFHKRSAPLND